MEGPVSDLHGDAPLGVFVTGMYKSGLEIVAEQLQCLGLGWVDSSVEPTGSSNPSAELTQFSDQLLDDLGATWSRPALLPRLELLTRLTHRKHEARSGFGEAMAKAADPGNRSAWVWADPRHAILAPFWIETLG